MIRGGWQFDPDHRFTRPRPQVVAVPAEHVPAGEAFPDGIDGARSAGDGHIMVEDDVVAAARRRAVRALGGATTAGIPPLGPSGNLPAGVHAASHGEFLTRFGGTERREELLGQFRSAMRALGRAGVEHVVVGGSMVGAKPAPGDLDLAWVPNARTTTDEVDAAMKFAALYAPDVTAHRADRLVENAPTIPGARPGENFLELFSHDRAGTPRGVVLLSTADDAVTGASVDAVAGLAGDAATSFRSTLARQAMAGVRALSTI